MSHVFGAQIRRVEDRVHLDVPCVVAVATRVYDTTVDDLWEAVSTPERIARWFLPIEGDLRLGGRYQLKGNAGGTITRCDAPEAFDVTWEFGGGTSWVTVRLTAEGARARFTLEHITPRDGIGKEHFEKYGPAAVGVGWDLGLYGLAQHLAAPAAPRDHEAIEAWSTSEEGKAAMRLSGEAWGEADIASGTEATTARERAQRTIGFYTGT